MCAGRPLPFHGPLAKGAQLVEKSLAEFRVRRRESNTIRFLPRHVRGGKHFARSERRIVRYQRTTEAQSAAKLSRKSGKATFSTVSAPLQRGLSLTCLYVNDCDGRLRPSPFREGIGRAAAAATCVLIFKNVSCTFPRERNPAGSACAEPPPFTREAGGAACVLHWRMAC